MAQYFFWGEAAIVRTKSYCINKKKRTRKREKLSYFTMTLCSKSDLELREHHGMEAMNGNELLLDFREACGLIVKTERQRERL